MVYGPKHIILEFYKYGTFFLNYNVCSITGIMIVYWWIMLENLEALCLGGLV